MGYSKLRIPKNCEHCGKSFEAKTIVTRFCSNACGHKADNARKKAATPFTEIPYPKSKLENSFMCQKQR